MSKKSRLLYIGILFLVSGVFTDMAYPVSKEHIRYETAKVQFKKGIIHFNRMHYLAAVEYFRKAIHAYPDYFKARDYLSRSYKLAGFTEAALKEMKILASLSPENVAISARIDSIRYRQFRHSGNMELSSLLLNREYESGKLKRFGFDRPVDITVDNEKNVYISSFSSGKLSILDANGRGKEIITPDFDGQLYGLDYFDRKIAVSDFKNDRIIILSKEGKELLGFGKSGKADGAFHGPEGLCFDNEGNLYVVDSGNHRVQKFNDRGDFILRFGEKGRYESQLLNPTDVALYKNMLYVTDTANRRIACFDDSGNFIRNISLKGLESPRGITENDGKLFVCDEKNGLFVYNPVTGKQRRFGSWDSGNGKFSRLFSSVIDRDGNLYCADNSKESVFVFAPVLKKYSNLDVEIASVDVHSFPTVAFYLNVLGRDGRPVYGLDRTNFRITENKARISNLSINYLKNKKSSVSIALCVDRSLPMRGYHNDIPWVSDFILKKMKKDDSVKVINYNSTYWAGGPFDWSRRRTISALRKRSYAKGKNTGAVLYNSISDLIPKTNRRAVVLVTDGSVDPKSFGKYTSENIIDFAVTHFIPVYFISFKKPHQSLVEIAERTGGMVLRPGHLNSLRKIYDRIKNLEEYRYVLVYKTYHNPSFKDWWSDVKVEVDCNGQKGIEWGGYFVP